MREHWIRVIVVEDHPSLLAALRLEMGLSRGIECVGGFEDFERAFKQIPKLNPDVLLLDIGLPGLDGIAGCELIKKKWPRIKVLIFSANDDEKTVLKAFAAGADGYLQKRAPREELEAAIEVAHRGGFPMSDNVREAMARYFRFRFSLLPKLSPKEKSVFELMESGRSHKEIAELLGMSIWTVRTHVKRIFDKHGASSAGQVSTMRKAAAF